MAVANDGTGNGTPGEADNVQTENVIGGSAADKLTGDANANQLEGRRWRRHPQRR